MGALRINELGILCSTLGFPGVQDDHSIDITLADNAVLNFANLVEDSDSIIGFRDTPWHFHDQLMLMTGASTYIELDELELLQSIRAGDVVIISRYQFGVLEDRWLAHKLEPLDIQHIEQGEELRVLRVA
jgi:hypothetical protein